MPTCKWYLPTLAEVMRIAEPHCQNSTSETGNHRRLPHSTNLSRAEREWYGAVAGLNTLLNNPIDTPSMPMLEDASLPIEGAIEGVVISGPLPVLSQANMIHRFSSWVLTGSTGHANIANPFHLLPTPNVETPSEIAPISLPLLPDDPLGAEPFCLVLTPEFSLLMALNMNTDEAGKPSGSEQFIFSFTPEVVWQGWRTIRSRLELTAPHLVGKLDTLVDHFAPVTPDYRLVADFSRLMLAHLPTEELAHPNRHRKETVFASHKISPGYTIPRKNVNGKRATAYENFAGKKFYAQSLKSPETKVSIENINEFAQKAVASADYPESTFDTELLQAIAHEVRTPLATIRTLTRLLLRQKGLSDTVMHRLQMIDTECTRQIDRFGLIFRAVELHAKPKHAASNSLAKISLVNVLQQNIPQWQHQAEQRNLTLDVSIPNALPMVLSDPAMLEQVLSGLMDQLTHALPSGSHIAIKAMLAGSQIKLQFFSHSQEYLGDSQSQKAASSATPGKVESIFSSTLKSVGQLLMFQPETGSLSLNPGVTKDLFHALGGKFTIRQYPHQGEVLTIFLPLDETSL